MGDELFPSIFLARSLTFFPDVFMSFATENMDVSSANGLATEDGLTARSTM